ncbi:MAG: Fe(2+) transporter permease subunit FeoB [Gammaproteobacteria bacterium]|nr:Fe(2+) transporter permease subunit FeoB [Gammaproteobacteria bacterium]MBU1656351.1 Fe(2+) transporter permease subunit FeoB [Gammaproteobacteria bacterium]MBU1959915.1 Fe(2+) transporter permease subunit FeoB [Gammaproteobacteria bacterium]
MGCCEKDAGKTACRSELTIALTGNPNCGKTALFNILTGIHQRTGNWPGVTVERKEGECQVGGRHVTIVDLPGIYSLDAASADERVTRDYLLSAESDLIVNVVDAANLERSLYLTAQLLEMGVPLILVLNMMDVARKRGMDIDLTRLAGTLGCPLAPIVAVTGEGLEVFSALIGKAELDANGLLRPGYDQHVEQALATLVPLFEVVSGGIGARWLAVKALEHDAYALERLDEAERMRVATLRKGLAEHAGVDVDLYLADQRYGFAHELAQQVINKPGELDKTRSDRIDALVLSRWWGVPIFLAVMYLMFVFTINIGGAFIDFFDGLAGAIFVDGLGEAMRGWGLPEWMAVILAKGFGGGVQVVATFIPIISALYLFLSALEDSGYMARAAFVMDRFMRSIGLPGKAFVPLIVGFGCNVPAIMATRTLEDERERRLTILMNPFMSCSARLPVYVLFAAAFFPQNGQNLVFLLYLIGVLVAVLSGFVMKKTLLAGVGGDFLMEMPRYHLPRLRSVLLRTWDRLKLFVTEAGQIIIVMVVVLNVLNSIGTDGSFGNEDSENSVLSQTGKMVTPLFSPMGIEQDNWPATVGIFSGILAKEVVVGTLDSIYKNLAANKAVAEQAPFNFNSALAAAAATIPANLGALTDSLLDPLGIRVGDLADASAVAEKQGVNEGLFGEMAGRFNGQVGAFAYLLFILLYFPCVAVIGAIVREAGAYWAMFVALWTTGVAYTCATLFYQIATFEQHPGSSIGWIVGLSGLSVLTLWLLRQGATANERKARLA